MRKITLLFVALLLCCISMIAQQRSESEAIQIAQEFFGKKGKKTKLSIVSQQKVEAQIRKIFRGTRKRVVKPQSFYIINDDMNNRFVIVSSDERFFEILGYSNNGKFDSEMAPPSLLTLLDDYNRQYEYLLTNEPSVPIVEKRSTNFPDIAPIIKSKWGQGTPYNDMCPYSIKADQNCVTGCVATAMAQVMRHHQWPENGQGYYSYTAKIDSTQSVDLEMDFSTLHFNWDNLIDVYKGGAGTQEQRAEVAKLMSACGISVAMNYGANGSGSQEYHIAYALTHYFDYNPNLLFKIKNYYSNEEWDELILGELFAGRPILYAGDAGFFNGHSFIIDGCAPDGTYHFNFGWEGYSDGNFYLQGTDKLLHYHNNQQMVYQVAKEEVGEHEDVFYSSDFISQKTALKIEEKSIFSYYPYCYSPQTSSMENIEDFFNGEVGIALYDKDFNFVKPLSSTICSNAKGARGFSIRDNITFTSDIFKNGQDYIIAPYAKGADSTVPTRIRTSNTKYDYYLAKVANDSVKLWIKGEEFHNIPAGIYKASATDSNGDNVQWYVSINHIGDNDYTYTIMNLDPIIVSDEGNKFANIPGKTNTSGKQLTMSYYDVDAKISPVSFETHSPLIIYYNENEKNLNISGEWGSIRKSRENGETIETVLSRYSNTIFTYMSPEETTISISDNKAGELSEHFTTPLQYFTNVLAVSGQLNGTDIKWIRNMLQEGSLMTLDIHNASIVAGGDAYYTIGNENYTTKNDTIGDYMFNDSKHLTDIKLPTSLKAIGEQAFDNCKSLKSLDIPEGVTKMESWVLSSCDNLERLTIPSTIQYIDNYALYGCIYLDTIYCSIINIDKVKPSIYGTAGNLNAFKDIAENCEWHVVKGKADLFKRQTWWKESWLITEDLEKPYDDEIVVAGNMAGELNTHIPDNLANYITSLTISGELNGTDIRLIRQMLQKGLLMTLDIHNASIVAGGNVYYTIGSKNYTTKNDTIGEYMFNDSKYLTDITLPASLKAICEHAFDNCKSLKSLDIPEGVTKMENWVLSSCNHLERLTIPSTIQYIYNYALYGCINLDTIHCSIINIDKVKPSEYGTAGNLNAFKNVAEYCEWHVVKNKTIEYESQPWWVPTWQIIDDIEQPITIIPGDSNGDGMVDVADIVYIVNYIMENPADDFNIVNADVDGDGVIDVADITHTVSIVMNSASYQNQLVNIENIDKPVLTNWGNGTFSLLMEEAQQYVASQFNIIVPKGTIINSIELDIDNHEIEYKKIATDKYCVVVYSLDNRSLSGDTNVLFIINTNNADSEISIEKNIFVTLEGKRYYCESITTDIRNISSDKTNSNVYTLEGKTIKKGGLFKGVFFKNGKKILMK